MNHEWDEFTKSIAEESVSRRESLRRLGFALVGTMFGSLGAAKASAARRSSRTTDPCKTFCKCRNRTQQDQCLKACNACGKNTSRLCGRCGSYVCCAAPGPNEYGACVSGSCEYWCAEGADYCDGACTFLDSDPLNCGACGNVCGGSTTLCIDGKCSSNPCVFPFIPCGGLCVDPTSDPYNCGGCRFQCAPSEACIGGFCESGG